MKFNDLISEISRLVVATPYTREEIAALWEAEEEVSWKPEILFAYGAAMEYMHKQENTKEAENIRGLYERRLDELKQFYSERPNLTPKLEY